MKSFFTRKLHLITFFVGLAALIWFIIRVVPKPSRAAYPCQRAAFPIASGFMLWLTGTLLSYFTLRRAKGLFAQKRIQSSIVWGSLSLFLFAGTFISVDKNRAEAAATHLSRVVELQKVRNLISAKSHSPLAYVGVVQSEKETMESLSKDDIESMVLEAIEKAGGLASIISNGDEVILKPNLVSEGMPVTGSGMVTDWRVVAAVAKAVRAVNPSGTIVLMEGTVGSTVNAFASYNYSQASIPEIDEMIALENACGALKDYEAEELSSVTLPSDIAQYPNSAKPNNSAEFYLNKRYLEADVLISIPVLKNHESAGVTGAVKNVAIGCTPPNIYARNLDYPLRQEINHFQYMHEFIHDFYAMRPVDFAVMDGLQGFSYGPVGNYWDGSLDELKENMRIVAASADPVALDAIQAIIMMDDPRRIPYLVNLSNEGFGTADPMNIKIVGDQLGAIKKDFAHYSSAALADDYVDTIPIEAQLEEVTIVGDTAFISLTTSSTVVRVDIEINGQIYDPIITSGFDMIEVPASGINPDELRLKLHVQNQYLTDTTIYYNPIPQAIFDRKDVPFKVYPNPVLDYLTIGSDEEMEQLMIYSQNGQCVLRRTLHEKTFNICCSKLTPGSYLLKVYIGNHIFTEKFVKVLPY